MTPAVRRTPPWRWVPLALLLMAGAVSPAWAQEKAAEQKNDTSPESKAQLLQDLDNQIGTKRSEAINEEERLAAARAALLAVKRELAKELERLTAIKKEVEAQIARRDKVVSERLTSISKIYQSMKPKEASSAIQEMDDDMAVAILERMPQKTVAKIFDAMPKERVRELTSRLEEGRTKRE